MLKKVLSVVLALVLTLGVCVVAASAASAADLEELLAQLPSAYNAQFYNEDTEAVILNARAAAETALETGTGINDAYALCEEAFDTAYTWDSIWVDAIEDYTDVCVNRDESRAVADFTYTTTATEYMKPGDTFDITISLKTNFYIMAMYTGFAYDKNVFEYVPNSITYNPDIEDVLDVENGGLSTTYGYSGKGKELDGGFPDTWTDDMKAQYGLFEKIFGYNAKGEDFFMPEEDTEIYTVTFKVKDDAALDSEARIFVNNDLCATRENYLLGGYNYPLVEFTRAYGPKINEETADLDGIIVPAWLCCDETAASGQTINFTGADFTVKVGEPPVSLDYTALEAAIASINGYDEADWTEASWADFAAAVEAGEEEGLKAETQEDIDAYTAAIVAKREALVEFVQDSEIISVTEKTTPVVGTLVTLEVLVSKPATKIQFVNEDGGTETYYDGYDHVDSITNNDDGTQTWIIKKMVRTPSETYKVFPKFGKVWDTKDYRYILKDTHDYDGTIYSIEVADEIDGVLYQGRHETVVKTGIDVIKVQFAYDGVTATYTVDNAKVEEKDGYLYWTINFNYCRIGSGLTYVLNGRTTTTAFEKSDVSYVVEVVH